MEQLFLKASKILDIVLTRRGKDSGQDIPMCGVPFHSCTPYIEKLVNMGQKIAICEQTESPEEAKKRGYKEIVSREVVRIITPGTLIEDNLISSNSSNYLVSLCTEGDLIAISWADVSTDDFCSTKSPIQDLADKIMLLSPREIIISDNDLAKEECRFLLRDYKNILSNHPSSYFEINKNISNIKKYYQLKFLDALNNLTDAQKITVGTIISYLEITHKQDLPILKIPKNITKENYMVLDQATQINLELFYDSSNKRKNSLLHNINHTKTAAGSRLLHNYLAHPLQNISEINDRLAKVSQLISNTELHKEIDKNLTDFYDIERILTRVTTGRASIKDTIQIKESLIIAQNIEDDYLKYGKQANLLSNLIKNFKKHEQLIQQLDYVFYNENSSLQKGNFIKEKVNSELDELKQLKQDSEEILINIQNQYRENTKINNLRIKHTPALGYFVEVSRNNAEKLADSSEFIHRQTLVNATRFSTEKLNEIYNNILNINENILDIETRIFKEITRSIQEKASEIKNLAKQIAELDVYCSFAAISKKNNFCKPELVNNKVFEIEDGYHPVINQTLLKESNEKFQKNNCSLDNDNYFWLLTGPNMSGKSTYMRQNAIIAILSHIGSYVPAKKAKIGIIDRVFSRVGASDNLAKGQSTFMVEMLETATIINQATEKSFLILDEIGRGTSTYDGLAIAWAISEQISQKIQSRCIFATHYHELTQLSEKGTKIKCYSIE